MDAKFKVGDRVMIHTANGEWFDGKAGVVRDVSGEFVSVRAVDSDITVCAYELELVEEGTAAMKFDSGKPRVSLIPSIAIEKEGAVLGFGEQKYASHNWRKGMKWSKLLDSAMRHIMALKEGEDLDPESGLPHWAHVRCNMGFLGEYMEYGLGEDDRFIQKKKAD